TKLNHWIVERPFASRSLAHLYCNKSHRCHLSGGLSFDYPFRNEIIPGSPSITSIAMDTFRSFSSSWPFSYL
ncbi:MAG: hypothetical protein ACRD5J_20495, partial [Nitrososphaeraceae archaeon]